MDTARSVPVAIARGKMELNLASTDSTGSDGCSARRCAVRAPAALAQLQPGLQLHLDRHPLGLLHHQLRAIRQGLRQEYVTRPSSPAHAPDEGASSIVEMLFCTSLVALVGAGDRPGSSPRRLQIVNTKRQSIICELTFPTTILAVKLNRRRLVVVLEEKIYVYDISNMKLLHEIETGLNTAGSYPELAGSTADGAQPSARSPRRPNRRISRTPPRSRRPSRPLRQRPRRRRPRRRGT